MNQFSIQAQLGQLQLEAQANIKAEFIVISGENGAGKTTLLRCLAGLESCKGSIHVQAETWLDSTSKFSLPTAERQIGFVWSDAVLLPWLDVQANIKLGSDLDKTWLQKVCEAFEVEQLLKRKPAMLSTGEAQRVALARACYQKPVLLLLDEPFSAQAPEIRHRLRLALQTLQKSMAIPVLMVSHDAQDAKVLANQYWYMREGKLLTSVTQSSFPRRRESIGREHE